jgi:hypothetical protein
MEQWFNEDLVAIQFVAEGYGYWKILELPPRVTHIQKFGGKFHSLERAEDVLHEQFPESTVVDPLDLAEEVERRKVVIARIAQDEED